MANNSSGSNTYVSRERHQSCLTNTIYHLEKSKENKNYDIFAEDIKNALHEIKP